MSDSKIIHDSNPPVNSYGDFHNCPDCDGTGICDTCDGTGFAHDGFGVLGECYDCNGGRGECQRCDGTGHIPEAASQ